MRELFELQGFLGFSPEVSAYIVFGILVVYGFVTIITDRINIIGPLYLMFVLAATLLLSGSLPSCLIGLVGSTLLGGFILGMKARGYRDG